MPGRREVFLTAKRTEWSFDPNLPDFSSGYDDWSDTDGDGMSDRQESLYGLDSTNPDTDGDGTTPTAGAKQPGGEAILGRARVCA